MHRALIVWLLLSAATRAALAQPAPGATLADAPPPSPLRWVQQATLPPTHPQAGDLCSLGDNLYIAASTDVLTTNGQALYTFTPDGRLAPVLIRKGQGFLRVHTLADRVFVPDADAPFTASLIFRRNLDGFVYSFDPRAPGAVRREVIPHVYHVFDTALLEGRIYAASGAYAEGDVPYHTKRNPAALYLRETEAKPWRRVLEYPQMPSGSDTGIVRFTFLHALTNGTLLAGLTDWSGSAGGNGAVLIEGLPDHPTVRRVGGVDGSPLRWISWKGRIYVIAERDGITRLACSTDGGLTFAPATAAPPLPQSLAVTDDVLILLADGTLYRSDDGSTFTALTAQNPDLRHHPHPLLTAPLAYHRGKLWAADAQRGTIWSAEP